MASPDTRPADVGILAMEVYFPKTYVAQRDLETFDGVSSGKYTLGLGQDALSFTGDREDVNSIALTVLTQLLEKHNVRPEEIGRLEVGTETLVDKSKSTKTVLMQLFEASGNTSVEGVTTVNACFGATAALFNSLAWVESSAWDGRFAVVVASDIAIYAKGSARPTGGCGAAAMLIGPNAPLVVDGRTRATFSSNLWDFYKPDPLVEFPTVDGKLSQTCYLHALDSCFQLFCEKNERVHKKDNFRLTDMDFAVFHSPYNKLVQRSLPRLFFVDNRRQANANAQDATLSRWRDVPLDKTFLDRDLDLASRAACAELYAKMTKPYHLASKQIGNAYTASVYINLAALVAAQGAALSGKRVLMFSYGSGCMASMFEIVGRDVADNARFSLETMRERLQIFERLEQRTAVSAEEYDAFMEQRARFHAKHSVTPQQPVSMLFDGAYYLVAIDAQFRRTYARKTQTQDAAAVDLTAVKASNAPESSSASAYVSGVSALLPGRQHPQQSPLESLDALLRGDNCIQRLSDEAVDAMLARNIVQLKRTTPGATVTIERHRVVSRDDSIQVAAVAPSVDLKAAPYHLPASMVDAMDEPTQLAVAAGLDAMRDAGLVRGNDTDHATTTSSGGGDAWRLPAELAKTTGVIYATSYPTMNATANEVARFHQHREAYELDRKLLFRVLVLANAQLAQLTGAKGPNTQINAACAGMTQAIAMAQDWLTLKRCERVIVVASDVASNGTLMPLIGSGFRVLGAASTAPTPDQAARPFDAARNGMVVGAGAAALVVESSKPHLRKQPVVRLLATRYANSAFHGASIDVDHVTHELCALFQEIETTYGITRPQFVAHGVYYSHETFTNASPKASCAYAEVCALRGALGNDALLEQLLIANTKGFTGHPMAVSFEDVAAVEGLRRGVVPPVANFENHDQHLGVTLRLARGGVYAHRYALRFAAGFGSQVAFTFYALE